MFYLNEKKTIEFVQFTFILVYNLNLWDFVGFALYVDDVTDMSNSYEGLCILCLMCTIRAR